MEHRHFRGSFPRGSRREASEKRDVFAMRVVLSCAALILQASLFVCMEDMEMNYKRNGCELAYKEFDAYCAPRYVCEDDCTGSCAALMGAGKNGCPLDDDRVFGSGGSKKKSPVPVCCIDCAKADLDRTCGDLDPAAACTNHEDCMDLQKFLGPLVWDLVHFCGGKFGGASSCGCCVNSKVYSLEVCPLAEEGENNVCKMKGGSCTTMDECPDDNSFFLEGLCSKHYLSCGCCIPK